MAQVIFALSGNEKLAEQITSSLEAGKGKIIIRKFPDGETYVRILSDAKDIEAILICSLHQPDEKLLPVYFLSKLLKDSGAKQVKLIAPYLGYMRQDKQFNPGEAVTSAYFASLVSQFVDELITIDPHLHRYASMNDIYSIPCKTLHASDLVSAWIRENVSKPVLIGPDSESEQWVSKVAENAGAPFIILEKTRYGDRNVKVSVPDIDSYQDFTPVLVDDIISTAKTMIETVMHLKSSGTKLPVCICVHPVFSGNAYEELKRAGTAGIISCDTIAHESNRISISGLLSQSLVADR